MFTALSTSCLDAEQLCVICGYTLPLDVDYMVLVFPVSSEALLE